MNKSYIHPGVPPAHPPDPPANDVFRLKIHVTSEGQACINTFYYANDAFVGSAGISDLDDLIAAALLPSGLVLSHQACLANTGEITAVEAECPTVPTLAPAIQTMTLVGTAIGLALPNQCAVTLAKVTRFRGKQGRGRISMPAVPEQAVTGTTLASPSLYLTLALKMAATISSGGQTFRPGLYGAAKQYANPPAGPIITTKETWVDLLSVSVRLILGTARRRKPGVGK
jgi:hypothetical protein